MRTLIYSWELVQQSIQILVVGLLDDTVQWVDCVIGVTLMLVAVMGYDQSGILANKKVLLQFIAAAV